MGSAEVVITASPPLHIPKKICLALRFRFQAASPCISSRADPPVVRASKGRVKLSGCWPPNCRSSCPRRPVPWLGERRLSEGRKRPVCGVLPGIRRDCYVCTCFSHLCRRWRYV